MNIKDDKNFAVKTFEIVDFKAIQDNGNFYLTGYANTKNKPDSYGDIPTSFNGQPIYDISRFQKNPVFLIDHDRSVSSIAGNFTEIVEDDLGLRFKLLLMPLDKCFDDRVKQAISAYQNGFARAFSIGGRWFYDDPKNPTHLTRAFIFEISGVAVPADEDSLCDSTQKPKSFEKEDQVADSNDPQVSKQEKLFELKKILIKKGVMR